MFESMLKKPFRFAVLLLSGSFTYFCFLLGAQYLNFSLTTESHFAEADKIFRLETKFTVPGGSPDFMAVVPMGFSPWIKNNQWNQIDSYTSFHTQPVHTQIDGKDSHQILTFADTNFLSFFKLGAHSEPLRPDQIILSERAAIHAFGTAEGLTSKPFTIPGIGNYTIREVIKLPTNSHFTFELLVTKKNLTPAEDRSRDAWTAFGEYFYFKETRPGSALRFKQNLNAQIDDYLGVQVVRDSAIDSSEIWQFDIIPFSSIYYHSNSIGQLKQSGDIEQVKIIAFILALLLVVFACVQALAVYLQNLDRKKEIFIKQTLGFSKWRLLRRLFVELMLINSIFIAIAAAVFRPVTSVLNLIEEGTSTWLSIDYALNASESAMVFAGLAMLLSVTAVLSNMGQYQFVLPNNKNSVSNKQRFAILSLFCGLVAGSSLIISICGLFFWNHWYSVNLDKGFDVSTVVAFEDVNIHANFEHLYGSVREELKSFPEVDEVTLSSALPGKLIAHSERISRYQDQDYAPVYASMISVSDTFAETVDANVIHGRFFLSDTSSERWVEDSAGEAAIIVSEALAREMGFSDTQKAVGQQLSIGTSNKVAKVVGVVGNWRIEQAHKETGPFALIMNPNLTGNVLIKLNTPLTPALERKIKGVGDKWLPGLSATFVSVNDIWQQQFSKSVTGVKVSSVLMLTLSLNLLISLFAITEFIFSAGALKTVMSFLSGAGRIQLMWISSGSLVTASAISAILTAIVLTLSSGQLSSSDVMLMPNPSLKAILLSVIVFSVVLAMVMMLTMRKILKLRFSSQLFSE